MNHFTFKILVDHREEIQKNWRDRIETLLPELAPEQIQMLVQELMTGLRIYLVDSDREAALRHLQRVAQLFFPEQQEVPQQIVNSLLIARYILLASTAKHAGRPINSLAAFGQINDLLDPLIRGLSASVGFQSPGQIEEIPFDFAQASQSGLLTVDFEGIGLFMLDRNYRFLYWSNGMERIFGLTAAEVLGRGVLSDLTTWGHEPRLRDAFKKASEEGKETAVYGEAPQFINQKERILNLKIAPLRDGREKIIGISVLVQDITEYKKNQQELRRYEEYFKNILNDAADAIIILDENDGIVMWNRAAVELYGWSSAEAIGQSIALIVPDDAESQKEIVWIGHQVREKGFVRNFRGQRLTREGKQVLIDVTRTAIRNEKGEYIGSSVIARDMTQQEQLRQQLVQSEKLSAVGTLAAGIAHEIGSPLTAISSLTQLCKARTQDEYLTERLTLIQQSIDRISRTVKTLVDFSRPIAQKIEPIYLNHVVENVVQIIKYDKRLKYQEVHTELDPHLPLIRGSFDQILQVFINISLNAADAMEHRKEGRLLIKTWFDSNWIYASVTDNGNGIAPENLPHIFEPFFSTKKPGKGTGLGLWVSFNIIKSFSGNIQATSVVGEGTVFTISLPKMTE